MISLYGNEINGLWYLISEGIPGFYDNWPKFALIISIPFFAILFVFLVLLTLYFFGSVLSGKSDASIIRRVFFYKNKNALFLLDHNKHPTRLFYRPGIKLGVKRKHTWYDATEQTSLMLVAVIGFGLFAWGFWYLVSSMGWPSILTSLLPLKFIFVLSLLAVSIYLYFYGHLSLMLMLLLALVLNLAYFYGIDIGYPIITAHYQLPNWTVNFFTTWAFGWHHPLVINPNGYDIDINKYVYVIFLLFTYYSLLRYVLNFFYWKVTRHPPNKLFYQYFSEEELAQRRHAAKAEADSKPFGGVIKNINPDIDLGDDSKPKTFAHEREMKLLGFTDKTIAALRGQYSDAQIVRALDAVMEKGGANPKMTFINELEEHNNG